MVGFRIVPRRGTGHTRRRQSLPDLRPSHRLLHRLGDVKAIVVFFGPNPFCVIVNGHMFAFWFYQGRFEGSAAIVSQDLAAPPRIR